MRMRPHIDALPALELRRAKMIEEYERSDRAPVDMRQRPADREPIEVDRARDDHGFKCITGVPVAGRGIFPREKAHESSSSRLVGAITGAFPVCRNSRSESQMPATASGVCRPAMRETAVLTANVNDAGGNTVIITGWGHN